MLVIRFWFWEFRAYELKHCLVVRFIWHQCIQSSMHYHLIHLYSYHNLWFVLLAWDRDPKIAIHFHWIMIVKMNMFSITIIWQHLSDNNYSLTLNKLTLNWAITHSCRQVNSLRMSGLRAISNALQLLLSKIFLLLRPLKSTNSLKRLLRKNNKHDLHGLRLKKTISIKVRILSKRLKNNKILIINLA